MRATLIDYGSGNLASAAKALARAAADTGTEVIVTADARTVGHADRIILPGVGAFADCMRGLAAVPGMVDMLREKALNRGTPFLGICVGMQLLASIGHEFGAHSGLGWIPGDVIPMAGGAQRKIPHMGWNELKFVRPHPLFAGLTDGAHGYFVHSFEMKPASTDDLLAVTDYGGDVTAAVGRGNIAGTQFHPEKSQATGLTLLANFLRWSP